MLVAGLVRDKIFYALNYRSDKSPLQRLQAFQTTGLNALVIINTAGAVDAA